jgi:hypothetical protein
MSEYSNTGSNDVIRVTREDAMSQRVDDLLKRQMSLRGEPGITRDGKRRWWYQNWLVFALAGALAALAAWAVIEPLFDDLLYFQGAAESINTVDRRFGPEAMESAEQEFGVPIIGIMEIRGEQIWVLSESKALMPDGTTEPLDLDRIIIGDEVGVHVEYNEQGADSVAIGAYLVHDPPPQPAGTASLSLRQLNARSTAGGLLLFPLVAAFVGLAIGAADGIVCRLPRRAFIAGGVGLLAGFIGGFLSELLAELVYAPITILASQREGTAIGGYSTWGFLLQTGGRGLAWCVAGLAMGLGQGLALRSTRLLVYGLMGGVIGGLLGGLFFDPIYFLVHGVDQPSAHWSRLVGLMVIGTSVGAMIGVVELLARDAWLRMTQGPLSGKEFLIFKDLVHVGSSPRSDIYLFNDAAVRPEHAVIRAAGDHYEIEGRDETSSVLINGHPTRRTRLRHGDQIGIGDTRFVFQSRRG